MIDLSIILPVHNEAKSISKLSLELKQLLKKAKVNPEIIFVENGSTDNSFKILSDIASRDSKFRVYQSRQGWGNAVRKGIQNSHGKYILYMVSNGQVPLKHITHLYKMIIKDDIAMAKVTRIKRENLGRLLNSRIYNFLSIFLFGLNSLDINGTPKIIKSDILKKIPLKSENIGLDLELMLHLKRRRLIWKEIPIESEKRIWGKSSTNFKSAIEMLSHMIMFRLKL